MDKSRFKGTGFYYEIDIYEKLYINHGVKNLIFYKGASYKDKEFLAELEEKGVSIVSYTSQKNLITKVKDFQKQWEILYVNTTAELLINTSNRVKKELWQKTSKYPKMFRDKYIQRKLLQDNWGQNGIKFFTWTIKELDFETLEEKVGTPFILKPTNGLQSSWVVKINNKQDFSDYTYHYIQFHENCHNRWFESDIIIAEEFIDGRMYSIDYFVSQEWEITMSKPIWVEMWVDLWIDDYFNAIIHASHDIEKQVDNKTLSKFVDDCVDATKICNTYIHHEFKITSKWEFKTIEMNGRIWGSRVEHMLEAYDMNLYEFILWLSQKNKTLVKNYIKVNIYAHQRGILAWINQELIQKVKIKKSTWKISVSHKTIWSVTGLTKDWFTRVIVIKLKHKNYTTIKKDLNYIKKHYKEFLYLDDESKFIEMVNYIKTLWYTLTPATKKKK